MSLKDRLKPPKCWFTSDEAQDEFDHWYHIHIESLFKKAVEVYCSKPDTANSHLWSHFNTAGHDTHHALLIGIEPINPGVTKDEILEVLSKRDLHGQEIDNLVARIKSEGIKA